MSFQVEFDSIFEKYKIFDIAVYGSGKIAESLFESINGYNFTCIIDPKYTGTIKYNIPVVSLFEAIKNVSVILIAASESSKKIIYHRIKDEVPNSIVILDMFGNRLNEHIESMQEDNPYWKTKKLDLYIAVDSHDVISFDIFDTLIMRKVPYPEDVFCIIERELKKEGMDIPFMEWRVNAEKYLQCKGEPNIDDIYWEIKHRYQISDDLIQNLKLKELKWEERVVCPRRTIVEIFEYAKSKKKKVCLISDMYLRKNYIEKLLRKCGIVGYDAVYVSCEYGVSKKNGLLYKIFMNDFSDGVTSFLHIGDNRDIDFTEAGNMGMASIWIMNSRDLLGVSNMRGIINYVKTLDDRIFLGEFLATILNDPFALHKGDGKINICSLNIMAKACFSLFFMFYMTKLKNKADTEENTTFLFLSRDTYFIYKMYQKMRSDDMPEAKYLLSSRKVMRSLVLRKKKDIEDFTNHLSCLPYAMNLKYYLERLFDIRLPSKFDISVGEALDRWGKQNIVKNLRPIMNKLIINSKKKRKVYLKYLASLGVKKEYKLCVIDMQTTGTTKYFMENLLKKKIFMFTAFLLGERENDSFIEYMYRIYPTSRMKKILDVLEIVYASREGQLDGFTIEGQPVFNEDSRYNQTLLDGIQNGVEEFVDAYLIRDWINSEYSKELPLIFLELLLPNYSIVDESIMNLFDVYDPLDIPSRINYFENII